MAQKGPGPWDRDQDDREGFGIGHNLSLICQLTSEDIKHQPIIIIIVCLD